MAADIERYAKRFTREHRLIVIEMWEDQLTKEVNRSMKWSAPPTIFDATKGIATLYFREGYGLDWERQIAANIRKDRNYVKDFMKWYASVLKPLEEIFNRKRGLGSARELIAYYNEAARAWVGLDLAFIIPDMKGGVVSELDRRLSLGMRKKSENFTRHVDYMVAKTLRNLYPQLKEYADYVSINEVKRNSIPSIKVLKKRREHYIYFNYKLHTGISLEDFLDKKGFVLEGNGDESGNAIAGQAAVKGVVSGRVRIVMRKGDIKKVREGEIMVAPMTTPDYVPAMARALGIVTDEGGITCHAAINAREMGKPCIVGTKIAARELHNGDLVEVDANKGTVTKIRAAKRTTSGRRA